MYRYDATTVQEWRGADQGQEGSRVECLRGGGGGAVEVLDAADDRQLRLARIARIRREIAAGTYDTEEKFQLALGRLFERYDLV